MLVVSDDGSGLLGAGMGSSRLGAGSGRHDAYAPGAALVGPFVSVDVRWLSVEPGRRAGELVHAEVTAPVGGGGGVGVAGSRSGPAGGGRR